MKRPIFKDRNSLYATLFWIGIIAVSAVLPFVIPRGSIVKPKSQSTYEEYEEYEEDEYDEDESYTPFEDIWMEDVDSSCFSEVGYAYKTETLYVRFKDSGSLYRYDEVPSYVYEELMDSDSLGGYYNSDIKGEYPCTRIYE